MTTPAPRRDDATRLAELRAMRTAATGLLVVAGLIFIAASVFEGAYPWLGFVRATAEASLVGGLADWFAVTALFRHPLGIPIPHTAIIPTQKDRIGRILGGFVQNHFLSRDVLSAKLRSMRLAERIARWMADEANAERLARHAAVGVAQAIRSMPEGEVTDLIRTSAVARLQQVQLAPVLGNLLSAATKDDRHQQLLDEALVLVKTAMERNRELIREKIREESPWWVPPVVDEAFHRRVIEGAERLVEDVYADHAHPLRRQFDAAFNNFVERLKSSPEMAARTEEWKGDLLEHPMVGEFAASLWDRAQRAAERFTADPRPDILHPLQRGIASVGQSLASSEARLAELDDFLTNFIAGVLEQHRHEVGDLIADTVKQWDPKLASDRIELAVGRDLQFIRLNGTLVGGLAGLVIYTVTKLLE
ncbi:MAG TPA: DUF445 domain-containing protein [Gemmatimonadales bacterium]|nr:DUF445 domain-containing protein [Gemmatimonadales bacterium]